MSGWDGSASRSASQRRRAPAHMAITTSLTETPKAFFICLTVSRSTLRNANLRCGVIGLLNGVAGARPGTVAMTSPSPRFSPSMPPTTVLTTGARVGSTLTSSLVSWTVWTGRQAAFAAALAASAGQLGAFSGWNGFDRRQLAAGRGEIEQDGEELGAGRAVDRRMVDLGVDRGAPAGQPGDQVDLPQRAAAVQRPGVQPADLLGQLGVRSRARAARVRGRGTRCRSPDRRSSTADPGRTGRSAACAAGRARAGGAGPGPRSAGPGSAAWARRWGPARPARRRGRWCWRSRARGRRHQVRSAAAWSRS